MDIEARENYLLSISFAKTVKGGERGLSQVPQVLKGIIKRRAWENIHCEPTNQMVHFANIKEWIEAYPPEGLDTKPSVIEALIKDDDELSSEFQKLIAVATPARENPGNPTGRNQHTNKNRNCVNNTIPEGSHGSTNREYLTRVMARDCPEILDQIGKDKKYRSVRAAAIDQGIIKPRLTVSWKDGEDSAVIAGHIVEKLSEEQLREVFDHIRDSFGWYQDTW